MKRSEGADASGVQVVFPVFLSHPEDHSVTPLWTFIHVFFWLFFPTQYTVYSTHVFVSPHKTKDIFKLLQSDENTSGL